ncbi:hypothetical protein ACFX12_024431 [Malus domestica]
MSSPSDRRFDLNFGEEAAMSHQDNIWRSSFLSPTGPLTIEDSVMKNDMTAAMVAMNLLTPRDNILLSKRYDELDVKNSLTFSVQCAGHVSNMAQRLFARTCQVKSLAAEVISLKQEIRGLKHENKQLHRLAHNYVTNMKRKLDRLQESDGQILLDHQKFVGLFQRHLLPSSSKAVPRTEAPNDQPLVSPPSGVLPSIEAPNDHPPVPHLSRALPTAETSPKVLPIIEAPYDHHPELLSLYELGRLMSITSNGPSQFGLSVHSLGTLSQSNLFFSTQSPNLKERGLTFKS